jgi:hypothetical protein
MLQTDQTFAPVHELPVEQQVQQLLASFTRQWWDSPRTMPEFNARNTPAEQAANEQQLSRLVDGLIFELKHLAPDAPPSAREDLLNRLREPATEFGRKALSLEESHLAFLESCGLLDAVQTFGQMARRFDPAISGQDIYQAGRNVMTAGFIQLLLNLPVEVTPALFAYSMLYPYTDNYLDDPAIPAATKRSFNLRFAHRLQGERVLPANRHETIIGDLIAMMEGQYPRDRYPQVWDSLLAIHAAQVRSLSLVSPGASPFELDVLGISFEKGGTSVLADGYLVAGWLSPQAAAFCFGYGCFTQLMDDLEDVENDRREGQLTVFTQTLPHWPLDAVTNRMIHFGRRLSPLMAAFDSPTSRPLQALIERSLDPVLIDIAGRAGAYYSSDYRRALESYLPLSFSAIKKQRARLNRHHLLLGRLVEVLL